MCEYKASKTVIFLQNRFSSLRKYSEFCLEFLWKIVVFDFYREVFTWGK